MTTGRVTACGTTRRNMAGTLPIETLDRATFKILDGVWAKDCCRVYYFNREVEGADPATFEVINAVRGRDKDYYYLTGFRQRTVQEEADLQQRRTQQK